MTALARFLLCTAHSPFQSQYYAIALLYPLMSAKPRAKACDWLYTLSRGALGSVLGTESIRIPRVWYSSLAVSASIRSSRTS